MFSPGKRKHRPDKTSHLRTLHKVLRGLILQDNNFPREKTFWSFQKIYFCRCALIYVRISDELAFYVGTSDQHHKKLCSLRKMYFSLMMRQYYDKEWYAFWNLLQGTVDKIDKIQIEIRCKSYSAQRPRLQRKNTKAKKRLIILLRIQLKN